MNHQIINLWGQSYGGGTITSLCLRKCDDNYNDRMNTANTLGEDCVPKDDGITHQNDNHFSSTPLLLSTSSSAS